MDIIPRIGLPQRRDLLQMGRKSGDPATALRFLIVARLGLCKTSPEVATELDGTRSTVVLTAHRYAEEASRGSTTSGVTTANRRPTKASGGTSCGFFGAPQRMLAGANRQR